MAHNYRMNVTKDEVIEEIRKIQSEGHSLKSSEMEGWLYRGVQKHFGGWKQAKKALGISNVNNKVPYRKTEARRRADKAKVKWTHERIVSEMEDALGKYLTRRELHANCRTLISAVNRHYGNLDKFQEETGMAVPESSSARKYADEQLNEFIIHKYNEGISSHVIKEQGTDEDRRKYVACCGRYGSWNKALEANGLKPVRVVRKFSSKEEVIRQYLKDLSERKTPGDITYRGSVKKYFGSFEELDAIIGIDKGQEYELYSKEFLNEKVYDILSKTTEPISTRVLDWYDGNIAYSIRQHYGSITDYFSRLDIDFYATPRVPFRWDAENTKRQLMRWIREGKPVNYTYVARNHTGIIEASRRIYGGWQQLFEACGLDYDDYRTDTTLASYYGKRLEDFIEEVLQLANIEYEREPEINGCHPDFVLGSHWIDAKLSEWTISSADCGTVAKYEPHCEQLTIVFLRGGLNVDKKVGDKTRLIHVTKFLEVLPEALRKEYTKKAYELFTELKERAS